MAMLNIKILTMDGVKFSGDAQYVVSPGAEGQLTILPSHAALLTELQPGEVEVHTGGDEHYIAIAGGVMEVVNNKVTILADAAERDSEIDIQRAKAALERAQQQIAQVKKVGGVEEAIRSLARARARLKTAAHRQSS